MVYDKSISIIPQRSRSVRVIAPGQTADLFSKAILHQPIVSQRIGGTFARLPANRGSYKTLQLADQGAGARVL